MPFLYGMVSFGNIMTDVNDARMNGSMNSTIVSIMNRDSIVRAA
jgi:hypothetical protein